MWNERLKTAPRMIRVFIADEKYRPVLRHPTAGFLKPLKEGKDEGTLWPADQFTKRRIVEGVIFEAPSNA